MKKLTYEFKVTHLLTEEDQLLSEDALKEKYFEWYYDQFRALKDNVIGSNDLFVDFPVMKVEEEQPGEREKIREIKSGSYS